MIVFFLFAISISIGGLATINFPADAEKLPRGAWQTRNPIKQSFLRFLFEPWGFPLGKSETSAIWVFTGLCWWTGGLAGNTRMWVPVTGKS